MMKKRFLIIALLLVLLGVPTIALASNIDGARYYGIIHIQNDSTATTNVATTCNISTQNLIDGDYLNASANNCVIKTSAGADMPFMPAVNATYPWCLWVASIGTDSSQTDILYTANSTGGEIRYFPGTGGMTTADNETLELGDNFTIEQKGWVDTTYEIIQEDFTTYTEEDDNGKLTVTATRATGVDVDRDEDVLLYKDKGADYFDALDIDFEIFMASTSLVNAMAGGPAITNTPNVDITGLVATDISFGADQAGTLHLAGGNLLATDYSVGTALDTLYYCTMERAAGNDSVSVKIYDDAPRTNLIDTVTVVGFGATKYRYVYGFINYNDATGGKDFDGYVQNLDLTGTGEEGNKATVYKQGAFQTYISAAENITSAMSGANVTATGISSGERKVVTTADTANLTISVYDANNVLISSNSTALTANVTDTSANWTFLQNDVMPYMEYQKISINGTLKQHIVWEYDTTFHDLSVYGNDATPTFRTASSDADVSAELVSFQPVAEAKAPDYILGAAPPFIDVGITGNVTGTFTTTPGAGTFPLAGVIIAVANATKTPPQLPLLIIAVFIILAASLTVSAMMRQYGSGSLLVKIVVIVAFMGVFIALGNFAIDFWMLVVFLILAVCIAFMSKQVGWT